MFEQVGQQEHESVHQLRDNRSGLSATIAIHSTTLGPAGGGCRAWHYASEADALTDALRLAQGMSYKNALANLAMGGGKAVIALPKAGRLTEPMLKAFGDFVDSLDGRYVTAEDVGMSEAAMETIATRTRYVTGLPQQGADAGGDPSPKTALGVFHGIKAALRVRFGSDDLSDRRVAVQGVGNVGYHLCRHLHQAGARLVVADINRQRVEQVCDEFHAEDCAIDEVLFALADVVSPCALGAILNSRSIPKLRAPIVAGGANNQLARSSDGQALLERNITYAPDYVINAGGIISCACEYQGDVTADAVLAQVAQIGPRLDEIFSRAQAAAQPSNEIADQMARAKLAAATSQPGH